MLMSRGYTDLAHPSLEQLVRAVPEGMNVCELAPAFTSHSTWERGPCTLLEWHSRVVPGGMSTGEVNNSATSQAQEQGFELVYPNNYPMDELLELRKKPASPEPKLWKTTIGYPRGILVRIQY